ncbi:D-3-phosphoglycerate dehydrogenase [Mesorhizobium albiziae]|uniref:D-3-phosphoglycerate dehydrogenase n=1 Tax=Neomesorhizobium albiziae TaxID=335020 RepID=A0A1I3UZU4_9HYPH|nr:hydroxyacid dehydrogenase [Mesorhizobium albiziae]GLS28571.1 dehydrogenase [Mesorhizobium albiziae]SFJ88440.1 D-3-phosphoglycerate dehydrogenase [Mesorhizobium albiziae]
MPDQPKILSTHVLHPAAEAMLAGVGELAVASALDAATLTREAGDADIVIVRAPMPPELFSAQRRLKMAVRHGAGLDWIPMEAATEAGVLVANVPGVNARTVAEHVLFGAMAVLRRFRQVDRDLRQHGWLAGREHSVRAGELGGKTIGIVGMGNIGRHLVSIARDGFGMTVIANSRTPESLPAGIAFRTLDALMAESDIVAICCPLTPQTSGMIDARRIALMKPAAVIVNVARGPIIVDDALIAALRDDRIGGAALDVFATQPLPPDHPYFGFDNVVVTPHMAGITEESMMRMGTGAAAETLRVLAGELPVNLRNPEVVERYRARFF